MAIKTTLILPDVQHPYHDKVALSKILNVAEDIQPEAILSIGDLIDFPTISRWAKDTALEYSGTLQGHIDGLRSGLLVPLRERCPNSAIDWLEGNHDKRAKDYVKKYGPALAGLRNLSMESLFGLDELDINYVKGPHRVGTNTLAIHGHEAEGYCSNLSAWDTKFTKRYGSDKNFIFGHTHQPGIVHRAYGYAGKVTPRFTMNVGSVMDPVAATYVKDGAVSWTMSFALLRDDGKRVWPELVTMVDRLFYVSGKRY